MRTPELVLELDRIRNLIGVGGQRQAIGDPSGELRKGEASRCDTGRRNLTAEEEASLCEEFHVCLRRAEEIALYLEEREAEMTTNRPSRHGGLHATA